MGIRVDMDCEQEVTAQFEIYDEEPDGVRAEYPSDILELMDVSNISMGEVITEAIGCGVDLSEAHTPTFDMLLAFIDADHLDATQLRHLIGRAVRQMCAAIDRAEGANKTLREELDRLAVPNQQTAEGSAA